MRVTKEMEDVDKVDEILHQSHLPHDLITHHMLTRLPIKSLLLFKSVSKQWYSTLSSYQFAHTHFKLSSFSHTQFFFIQNKNNYYLFSCNDDEMGGTANDSNKNLVKLGGNFHDEELVLIGSCNGLVCLASFSGCFFILWNPITGRFCKYSDPDISGETCHSCRVSWGFGYVSSIDDYKIVRILEMNDTREIKVHVFSLKSNKWTQISNEHYQCEFLLRTTEHEVNEFDHVDEAPFRYPYAFHSRQGVLVNEVLYWIVSEMIGWGRKIVAFDLVLEKFDTIVDLDLVSNDVYWDKFLCVMGGCLSKCGVNMRDDVSITMLKGPGKVESICLSRGLRLRSCQGFVGFTRTGKFYILLEDSTIGIINPNSQPKKYTPLVTFESLGKSRVTSYFPSLISPYTAV